MKTFKLFLAILVSTVFLSSCSQEEPMDGSITLGELMSSYDLWYVDIHQTMGNARSVGFKTSYPKIRELVLNKTTITK